MRRGQIYGADCRNFCRQYDLTSGEIMLSGERGREKKRYEFFLFFFFSLDNDTEGKDTCSSIRFANKHFCHGI